MAEPTAPTAHAPNSELSNDDAETYLRSMFPDMDQSTLHDCFVVCERNVERTVEFLLGTAEEPDASSARVNDPPGTLSQHDMDAQLALQLEQEELAAAAAAQSAPRVPRTAPAYAPRVQGVAPANPSGDEPSIQEQFMKIAETGKKTFNTLFAKVKDKLKEFDESSEQPQYYAPPPSAPVTTPYASTSRPVVAMNQANQTNMVSTPPIDHATRAPVAPATTSSGTSSSAIEASKPVFLDKKPTPLVETSRPHPEEDLTENPFDDRDH